jgi:hypothetical protein
LKGQEKRPLSGGGLRADVPFDTFEADEFLFLFIPQAEGQGLETFHESQGFDVLKDLVGIVTGLEVVVGDSRAKMVNVMETDVSREPLENFGEFIKRTSFESGTCEIPVVLPFPVDAFELVLNVEKPDSGN